MRVDRSLGLAGRSAGGAKTLTARPTGQAGIMKDYALQEPGPTAYVRGSPRGREDLERDVRGMESRDRAQEAARARWIEVEEAERDQSDGKTTSREEKVT